MCIYRWPLDLSVVRPRSHCTSCEKFIAWYDNIPLVSYAILGGRCRYCRARIFWRYPVVELATAVLFFYSVAMLGPTLAALGVYLAFTIPVSVFPTTNFPRVLIAVDNGVMPIDQMMVTITRPLEEAVNSVPGLTEVRSITSRGEAEIDLFFDWNVDMFQTL